MHLLVAGSVLTLASCYAPGIEIAQIMNHSRCSTLKSGAQWVTAAQLPDIRGVQMMTATPAPASDSPVSASNQLLLAISRGTQPTPGYAFSFDSAQVEDGELTINVDWHTPDMTRSYAQVVTSPCVIFGIISEKPLNLVQVNLDGEAFSRIAPPQVSAEQLQSSFGAH